MRLATFKHDHGSWSVPWLPALDSEQTLVLVFSSPDRGDDPLPFADLRRAYPRSYVVGCSAAGELHGLPISGDALVVAVAELEWSRLRSARSEAMVSAEAAEAIARELAAPDLRGLFVIDGRSEDDPRLAAELATRLPSTVPISRVHAAASGRDGRSFIVTGGVCRDGGIVAIGLYGSAIELRATNLQQIEQERLAPTLIGDALTIHLDANVAATLLAES